MRKQVIEITVTRQWSSSELRIPWLTHIIGEALKENDIERIEVKNVRKRK